ncbi:MAG: CPBP family intramembrane glutamic endopeptidase [Thermoplasmata archaeon]
MGLPAKPSSASSPPELASALAYVVAVAITVVAILSQYFLPQHVPSLRPVYSTLLTGLLVVYGIPILAFVSLIGLKPLRGFFSNPGSAVVEGLRWYGAMSILGLLAAFTIVAVLLAVDPSAVSQLSKLSPPLVAAESDPWFWVAFSFVIGIVEETIFRGWIFGYCLLRDPPHWVLHAVWTSALFASMHLYYGSAYGFASGVAFAELFFAGLAFSFAVRYSRGNLLVVGLLHGAHDALSFSTLVWKPEGEDLYYLLILVGAIVFVVVAIVHDQPSGPMTPWQAGPAPPPTGPGGNPAILWPPGPAESFDRPPLPSPPPPTEPRPPAR